MMKIIKGGTVVTTESEFKADVLIQDGKIVAVGRGLSDEGAEVINASEMFVMPGGIDQHVHFSFEFKGEKVRGFETSNAAALGGTTTVIEFVNQEKGKGLIDTIEDYKKENAEGIAMVDYSFHAVITDPSDHVYEEISKLPEMGYPSIKLFMAYKGLFFHADDDVIAKSMAVAKKHGVTMMVHAENADLIDYLQRECVEAGNTSPYYHAISRPPIVEIEATERAINIAKMTGTPLYVVHVSTTGAVDAIKAAKVKGVPIYGETCTHYLTLDKENLARSDFEGAKYVCSPALRDKADREYLWESVKKGWLNAISSDHCGFDWKKQKHMGINDFRDIPNGAPGMENRLSILWTYGVEKGKISRSKLVELFSTNPAMNNGLDHIKGSIEVGHHADIVIYNPKGTYKITNDNSLQGTDYNSYEGFEQKGRVETVLLRGDIIVKDNKFIGQPGQGQFTKCKAYGLVYR
ncbi:MAG: dihydropyrimidinase [Tissierellia bacterium]|nr:dihydropyrimidinase [Tissierellia bacterium]